MTATVPEPTELRRRFAAIAIVLIVLLVAGAVAIWTSASRSSARFGDAEILRDNQLGAATLAIEVGSQSTSLTASNLAPGDDVSAQIDVTNVGSLPLLLSARLTTGGTELGRALEFSAWTTSDRCRADDLARRRGTPLDVDASADTTITVAGADPIALAPDEALVLCFGARLPLTTGDAAQGSVALIDVVLDAVHDIEAEDA